MDIKHFELGEVVVESVVRFVAEMDKIQARLNEIKP